VHQVTLSKFKAVMFSWKQNDTQSIALLRVCSPRSHNVVQCTCDKSPPYGAYKLEVVIKKSKEYRVE